MICLYRRKTSSTVVILQTGPWAFSWLTLRSTEFCVDPLRAFWCAAFFVQWKFEFAPTIGESCVHWTQKRIGKFRKERMARISAWLPVLLFLLAAIIVFVLAILLGRALCISFRNLSQVCAVKRRNGENYEHKHAYNEVQVSANAAYGSRFFERTPRSFFNNRCLCYDDCATNKFAWCLQKLMSSQTAWTYLTLLEDRSYGDSKQMDFYLMEGTRHLSITVEASAFQASRLLTKG